VVVAGDDHALQTFEQVVPRPAPGVGEDDGFGVGRGQAGGDAGGPEVAAVAFARGTAIRAVDADAGEGVASRHGGLLSSGDGVGWTAPYPSGYISEWGVL